MQKLLISGLVLFMSVFWITAVSASDYDSYQDIEFEHNGARFLSQYSQNMYDKYYEKVKRRRFWGWRTYTKYKNEKVYFTKDTLYSIVNEGTSPIRQTFQFKSIETTKKQYDVSGNIKLKAKGEAFTIELGFEESLDWDISAMTSESYTEDIEIRVDVDPMTKLIVEIRGEGKISNGVAKYYRFWRQARRGGWEVLVVTTEYYSLRKEAIDET
ncbi:MAG: hypothetical protein K9L26_04830 [Candidatus Izimaplasma sp.]|nr:hypothetical protein [Candidatus Izimaplasma bacterium]